MSDERNPFEFHALSDDEELDRLLESVRRDIGEASPEPERPARAAAAREVSGERDAAPAPRQSEPAPAPRAQQIRQARPQPRRVDSAQQPERPAEERAGRKTAVAERELPPQRERIRVVHPEDEEPERKKSRFGLAFALYSILLALVLAAGCVVLWFYLDAYEATRPGSVMDEFTELADEDYWASAVEGAFTVGETPFEDRDELMDELCMSVIRSNALVWRADDGWTESNMVYVVSAGGVDICRVTLGEVTENGSAGFGFNYLEVTRVELLASFIAPEQHEITITVPAGAVLSINGVEVTEEYIASGVEPQMDGISELEAERASELFTVYRIGGLYAPVEIAAVDADGNVLASAGEPTDEAAAFALPEGTLRYRILVPEGSTVSVNGVGLGENYNTGETAVPAFLEGFDNYGTLPEFEVWEVEGLHLVPEIEVTTEDGDKLADFAADGSELTYFASGDSTLRDAHSSEVSAFVNAYVNYLTGAASGSADYTALQALVLDGSALDTALAELNGNYEENGLTVEHVYVRSGSFVGIGSTCYVCTVDVEYSDADGEEVNIPYTVVSVMYGGTWLAANVVS